MKISEISTNLVITGLMGTGKSTLGRIVAAELGREFVDTDVYLEERYGAAVDILNQPDGDREFCKIEENIACELAEKSGLVISTGGRFFINQTNIDVMRATSRIVCLTANIEELVIRLNKPNGDTYRPRFDDADDKTELMNKLNRLSEPYFSQFDQLETSGDLVTDSTRKVVDWFLNKT